VIFECDIFQADTLITSPELLCTLLHIKGRSGWWATVSRRRRIFIRGRIIFAPGNDFISVKKSPLADSLQNTSPMGDFFRDFVGGGSCHRTPAQMSF